MIPNVIEVGPRTVRGPDAAPREWASVAIECIDDRFALVDEQLVEVGRLWCDLLDVVAGPDAESLVLVFPTWWSPARVDVVSDAAQQICAEVVVLRRAAVLGTEAGVTVVELSEDFATIASSDSGTVVVRRGEESVAAHLQGAVSILVDVPAGVLPLPPALSAKLYSSGIPLSHSDRHRMVAAVTTATVDRDTQEEVRPRRHLAVVVGAVLASAALGGAWVAQGLSDQPRSPTALLEEGRVAIRVPADWKVERITSGPGSARLRVSAPTGDVTALHVTQSTGGPADTIAEVAESLWSAIKSEQPGVFHDFDPAGSVGGRPAVTYRELRGTSETDWSVVVDGAVRIAIGCQSPPDDSEAIRGACAQAVQSAHTLH